MRPRSKRFETARRRLAALALGLWLAGAGCLVCCGRTAAAAGHDTETATARAILAAGREAERAARASAPGHSCCKARVGTRARKSSGAGGPTHARGEAHGSDKSAEPDAEGRRAGPSDREQTAPAGACCRRALKTAEQARKPRVEPAHAHGPTAAATPPDARPASSRPARAARTHAPDRGGTYLLCRTLLI